MDVIGEDESPDEEPEGAPKRLLLHEVLGGIDVEADEGAEEEEATRGAAGDEGGIEEDDEPPDGEPESTRGGSFDLVFDEAAFEDHATLKGSLSHTTCTSPERGLEEMEGEGGEAGKGEPEDLSAVL